MLPADSRDRVVVVVVGLLVLFAPALLVFTTLEFLILTGDIVLSDLTLVEIIELYIIDLLLLAGFGYGIYRLTLWLIREQLPESLDALEADDQSTSDDGDPTDAGETQ